MNDGIPGTLCSLEYITIDDTVKTVSLLGPDTLMAKFIKNTFHLLSVAPADCHLLQMKQNNLIFIDTFLLFSLFSAPKLFNTLADVLQWITQQHGVCRIMHYLNDFLLLGNSGLNVRMSNKSWQHCQVLQGFRGSSSIREGGRSLHITILLRHSHWYYSQAIVSPPGQTTMNPGSITAWLCKKSATKREILSLVSLLQHAT